MSIYSIPSFISCILTLIPFYFIIKNWKKSFNIKILGLFIAQLWFYLFGEFFLINSSTIHTALFWDKFIYFFLSLIPASYLSLSICYPECTTHIIKNKFIILSLYFPALFFISLLPSSSLIAGMQPEYWGYGKIEGPAYNFLRIYIAIYFSCSFIIITYKLFKAKDPRIKNAMGFLGMMFFLPLFLSLVILTILQPFGINKFNIIAPSISFICSIFLMTYAIVKHRLFDLQLLPIPIIKTKKYQFHQSIKHLIKEIPTILSYEKIVGSLSNLFACDVALNVNNQTVAAAGGSRAFRDFQLEDEYELLEKKDQRLERQRIYLAHELKGTHDRFYQALKQNNIEVLIPLRSEKKLIGILKFGEGFSKNIYSTQDFNLITNLYEQLLIAINHISIMEERLQVKNKQLKVLKERIRAFKSSPCHALCSDSRLTKSFSFNHEASRPKMINAYYMGNDHELKKLLTNKQYDHLKIDNHSFDNADLIILDSGSIDKDLSYLATLNKPLLMITAQKEARKKVGEICPTLLKVFLNPEHMDTGLISAGQALLSVQRAVLYENNDHKLISMSPYIIELLPQIHAAASKADCILITGDTGTGKDLLASYISHHGRTEKMIPVNCAAIPEMLFESEFFGHDKGAFTGAVNKHRGLLEQARGGFLFLDEIGELSLNLQAKFLRILEGSSFERVGGNKPLQPHVRYIASTNQDLSKIVKQGRFRNDLLFRLNQVHFHLPPLDQRKEDIPLLAHYFLWQYNGQYGKDCRLGESYMAMLQQYPWTGHIRELANLIHQDVLSAKDGDVIEKMVSFHEEAGAPTYLVDQVQEYERKLIIEALELCGSQRAAANHLNLPLSTLHSKIKKYGLVIV